MGTLVYATRSFGRAILCATSRPYELPISYRFGKSVVDDRRTNVVTCNVPVLHPPLLLVGVLRVMRDIPNSIDIRLPLNSEILVNSDTAILLKREAGILEEACRWGNTGTHDDEVGWEWGLAFKLDRAAMLRVAI